MEDTDLLLTIAEIAVAFAGFSGLVTILGQRAGRVHPRLIEHTLRGMILSSLLVVAFSLFPFLPYRLGAPADVAWRISAAAYSVAVAAYFYSTAARRRELARSGVAGALSGTVLMGAAIGILSILGLLVLAAGLVGPGLYLFALFSGLFSAGILFFTVFMSLVPGRE
jgi:hypothetical protein